MESLTENRALLYSLLASAGAILCMVMGLTPEFSEYIQLVPLDSEVGVLALSEVSDGCLNFEVW